MRIIGTGSAVPERIVTNTALSNYLDTSDEWISTRTGIKTRRIVTGERLEELAAAAALKALAQANVAPKELDFIICSTVYNDYMTPALSCVIQEIIGADCPCIDINGACAGFVYALYTAKGYLDLDCGKILVICAETPTKMCDWTDRTTSVLFGDAAAAVVVEKSDDETFFSLGTQSRAEALYAYNPPGNCPFYENPREEKPLYMNGQEVYKFAVSSAASAISGLIARLGLEAKDIGCFLLHQANMRIIEAIRKRLEQPEDKFPANIANYGNTSSASLPLLLDELNRSGRLKRGERIIMSAFGAGLVTGTMFMRWSMNA